MKRNSTVKRAIINKTSTINFYSVLSSDGHTQYPLLITGPCACVCGCIRGSKGFSCYHRTYALSELVYVPVIEDTLDEFTIARVRKIEREYRAREIARFQSSDLPPAA